MHLVGRLLTIWPFSLPKPLDEVSARDLNESSSVAYSRRHQLSNDLTPSVERNVGAADRNSLALAVEEWLAKEWPFKKVGVPGRDIKWDDWRAIPVEKR